MSATPRLARFLALSPRERRVLGEALLLLPVASASLRLAGLKRTRSLLERVARPQKISAGLDAHAVARLVSIAARHGAVRAKCLSASLTLESLLRRHGMRGELRLGVRRHEGRFEAHAWIEHEGSALMEPRGAQARFAAFESVPPR